MPVLRMSVFTDLFVLQTDVSFLSRSMQFCRRILMALGKLWPLPLGPCFLLRKKASTVYRLECLAVVCLDRMVKFRHYLEYSEILLTLYLDDRALFLSIVPILSRQFGKIDRWVKL